MALFGLLLVFQSVNAAISLYRDKGGEESKTTMPPPKAKRYHITPLDSLAWWGEANQPDGNLGLQMSVTFIVKNLTEKPLVLLKARVAEPVIDGFVMTTTVADSVDRPCPNVIRVE
jgi:hypothetical protein